MRRHMLLDSFRGSHLCVRTFHISIFGAKRLVSVFPRARETIWCRIGRMANVRKMQLTRAIIKILFGFYFCRIWRPPNPIDPVSALFILFEGHSAGTLTTNYVSQSNATDACFSFETLDRKLLFSPSILRPILGLHSSRKCSDHFWRCPSRNCRCHYGRLNRVWSSGDASTNYCWRWSVLDWMMVISDQVNMRQFIAHHRRCHNFESKSSALDRMVDTSCPLGMSENWGWQKCTKTDQFSVNLGFPWNLCPEIGAHMRNAITFSLWTFAYTNFIMHYFQHYFRGVEA